jgi:hypothetical protein
MAKYLVEAWPYRPPGGSNNVVHIIKANTKEEAESLGIRHALAVGGKITLGWNFHATLLDEIPLLTKYDIEELEEQELAKPGC